MLRLCVWPIIRPIPTAGGRRCACMAIRRMRPYGHTECGPDRHVLIGPFDRGLRERDLEGAHDASLVARLKALPRCADERRTSSDGIGHGVWALHNPFGSADRQGLPDHSTGGPHAYFSVSCSGDWRENTMRSIGSCPWPVSRRAMPGTMSRKRPNEGPARYRALNAIDARRAASGSATLRPVRRSSMNACIFSD